VCGIFGIYSHSLPENRHIREALHSIRHRGPDDEGYLFIHTAGDLSLHASGTDTCTKLRDEYRDISDVDVTDFNLLLAHRRLAILDLSSRGHQPMSYSDGNLWITYNGEVFNYRELRAALQKAGYRFGSDTDTEVILAAYQEWGQQCVHRFNGQWAFCIYDRKQKRLFCSRDRFGIKPFYYCFCGTNFIFASEIKALLKMPFIHADLNTTLISEFLLFHALDKSEETIYKGIYQIPPSHNLILDLTGIRLRTEKYYDPGFLDQVGNYDHNQALRYADDIRDLLIDSVKIRLISDVPVGSCLSGGLDSSSIVIIINKLLNEEGIGTVQIGERQKTFTAAYDDPSVDERVHADEIIRHTNVDAYYTHPNAENLWRELDDFIYKQDGICFSTNIYVGWDLMRLASQHIKVVLNGQGGDELFGGYLHYEIIHLADMIREGHGRDLLRVLSGLYDRHGLLQAAFKGLMGGGIACTPDRLKPLLLREWYRMHQRAIEHLLHKRFPIDQNLAILVDLMKSLSQFLFSDFTMRYLPQLLHYDDRNAAAFSVENRVPFTDHRLVEYVSKIPSVYKMHRGWSKWLLRLAMRDLLPEKITWRKDKLGTPTPLHSWLTHDLSTVPQLMNRYGMRIYSQFVWRFFLADRLINGRKS
jgi:asparagine synthase (glutamine-hydrolysing)